MVPMCQQNGFNYCTALDQQFGLLHLFSYQGMLVPLDALFKIVLNGNGR